MSMSFVEGTREPQAHWSEAKRAANARLQDLQARRREPRGPGAGGVSAPQRGFS